MTDADDPATSGPGSPTESAPPAGPAPPAPPAHPAPPAPGGRAPLSDGERAAVFAAAGRGGPAAGAVRRAGGSARTPQPGVTADGIDRAVALNAGSDPIPRRFVRWTLLACAVLLVGGIAGEHFFGGGTAVTSTPTTTLPGTGPAPVPPPVEPPADPLPASTRSLLGLSVLRPVRAPDLALPTIAGRRWSLSDHRGFVVVLGFFDAACDDVCPVEAAEIERARTELPAGLRSDVQFVVVNTDPRSSGGSDPPAVADTGLGLVPDVTFLEGTLRQLDPVWTAYGVTVAESRTSHVVTHTDVLYFIDAAGRLRAKATPFADESPTGTYSLPAAQIDQFGDGIAETATGYARTR